MYFEGLSFWADKKNDGHLSELLPMSDIETMKYPQKVGLTRQLLTVGAFMRDRGIMHRDIAPDNVMYKIVPHKNHPPSIILKLIDFGSAEFYSTPLFDSHIQGNFFSLSNPGTPFYACPSLCKMFSDPNSAHHYGSEVDDYSIGALLYFLWAERPPFIVPNDGNAYGMEDLIGIN